MPPARCSAARDTINLREDMGETGMDDETRAESTLLLRQLAACAHRQLIFRAGSAQWWKSRSPEKAITILYWLAAATTSSSPTEPPAATT